MSIPVLPPSAPFTSEQRAYLNGFFAGVFGIEGTVSSNSVNSFEAPTPVQSEPAVDESTPWHDPGLGLDERMELAQGRPIRLQLMASMAQLDCGQCGYACKSYAEALADGSETSLRKCIPGGKETANKLKELMAAA
ncbi:hypothetical protein EON80_09155 [bacterium]|nr:MAG: hypothetical protein EON80_09155 [bacterium]